MAKKTATKKKAPAKKAKPHPGGRPSKGEAKLVTAATRVSPRVRELLEEKAVKTGKKLGREVKLSQYLRLLCRADVRQPDVLPLPPKKKKEAA